MAEKSAEHPATREGGRGAAALIGGRYQVDFASPLAGAGGGMMAFVTRDQQNAAAGLMALQIRPSAPARVHAIEHLSKSAIPGLLLPLAHGVALTPEGSEAGFVICGAPPGPSLAASPRVWGERELLECVLRPAAMVLDALATRGVTHRAIRPDNIFQGSAGEPVTLGAAWAGPPGSLQPALYEPPYVAMCHPAGRGDGVIADDIYALGVTLLTLALGRTPLAGLDDAAIIRRKLDLGSYAALVGEARLPAMIADLLRGMLAEDPIHRPPPQLYLDPSAARARRLAARPGRRAQRALKIADQPIWDARSLAYALARRPEEAVHLVRSHYLDHWLRRSLGDAVLAGRADDVVRQRSEFPPEDSRADATMTMRLIAVLDPLAPLCWRGVALWPDGLGGVLAEGMQENSELAAKIDDLVAAEAVAGWALMRPELCDATALRQTAQHHRMWQRIRGLGGGLARIAYALNPLQPCASPLLAGRWVARLADLLPALEAISQQPERRRGEPVDGHIAAFIAAHQDGRLSGDLGAFAGDAAGGEPQLASLRALSRLQAAHPAPLPGLAAWLVERAEPLTERWHNRARRADVLAQLRRLAQAGQLLPMLALFDDRNALATDAQGLKQALSAVAKIDAERTALRAASAERRRQAIRIGHEIAVGSGMLALASSVGWLVFG
ncbi:MAG: hypothetical protein LGL72_06140 [Acidibrevibacterium sp.]|jgi:hypothetical protein|uniref:hypothetical protein n=1 Tax=Acidibrevibacterium fodinaquatile TaxID=1969806 RepID=UPI0023A7DD94|nr:hypothetical protein [Acidibrevibacterium fodinaquatile]MCA7118976.1 hypothetical protein [Acidibrevibacterium fodinaquatile]